MLVSLSIHDIVLIDKLDLEFGRGLTILTGETGAGKSILLDAFSLALGARGDGGLIRQGQAQGQVSATFELASGHPALAAAQAQDIDTDGVLILRRVQLADGRSRAFVNDQRVTTQALRAIARELVEIHGQHDDRALVNSGTHRQLIDAFGGLMSETAAVRSAFAHVRGLKAESASEQARAEKVAGELRDVQATVTGDHSPIPSLSAALRRLERRHVQAPGLIAPVTEALDAALTALDLAGQVLD